MKNVFICDINEKGEILTSEFNRMSLRDLFKLRPKARYRLELIEEKRTRSQNNFYWFYINLVSKECGDDPNSLHEFFKRKFLPPRIIKVLGQEIKIPASTSDLKKGEMSDYMDRICALTNVPIPDPAQLDGYLPKY